MIEASQDINNLRLTEAEQILALEKRIADLEKIIDVYINPAPCVTNPTPEDIPFIDATKRRSVSAKGYGGRLTAIETRLNELWDWTTDLDCKIRQIKPKDMRPSISTQRSIDKILEALHKKENVNQYLTYKQIGDLLGVSKGRVCQLRAMIKSDGRLTISEHPTNHKERIVTLNPLWGKMV
jgi:hypothetical protein